MMHPFTALSVWLPALSLSLSLACATDTALRRTALVHAPTAPSGAGLSLEGGEVRISAHLDGINGGAGDSDLLFITDIVGHPGVLVPEFELGLNAGFGLGAGFELNTHFYYAAMSWAQPNNVGVVPFPPGQERDLFRGGLGLRYNIDVGEPQFLFGILGELNLTAVHEATFTCMSSLGVPCQGEALATTANYRLERIDTDYFLLPHLALQFGWDIPTGYNSDWRVAPYLLTGIQSTTSNIGFDNDLSTRDDSSTSTYWLGYLGFGIEAKYSLLLFGASVLFPLEWADKPINFGPAGNVTVGVQFN